MGTVEEWRIVNDSDMDHPFHLYGFFFQLEGQGEWRDTHDGGGKRAVTQAWAIGLQD